MSTRTDCHRPGAIVPRDYIHMVSYSNGAPGEPPVNLEQVRELSKSVDWYHQGRIHGHVGKCGVCGARFRHGDLFKHEPTGDLVHMGHECAEKYEMVADRDDWTAQIEALKKGRAARLESLRRQERYDYFCSFHDGLATILEEPHPIIIDMKERLRRWGNLSEKQVEFAFKIARQLREPKWQEKHVAAPEGRIAFSGVIVSKKTIEGAYGEAVKITIKVRSPEGSWLVWTTMPASLSGVQVGDEVELTATLTKGKDEHFAFGKRPAKARVIRSASSGNQLVAGC